MRNGEKGCGSSPGYTPIVLGGGMLQINDDVKGLDMTFQLDERQIALLASVVKQEWFDIIQKMMENEVKLLNIRLINTDTANPSEILANHAVAKGAGMFYSGFIQRLQQILQVHNYTAQAIGTPENPEQPPYQAEFSSNPADEVS
jgi:hypothetical protein